MRPKAVMGIDINFNNIALRGLNLPTQDVRLRGPIEASKAPEGNETPNPMRGKSVPEITKVPQAAKIT